MYWSDTESLGKVEAAKWECGMVARRTLHNLPVEKALAQFWRILAKE